MPAKPDQRTDDLLPSTPLEQCLPAETVCESESFQNEVMRRFGVELPVSLRVLGTLEFGATWLAVWFVVSFVGGMLLLPYGLMYVMAVFAVSGILIAILLISLSRPAWPGNIRTLEDLCRWILPRNKKAVAEMRRALNP